MELIIVITIILIAIIGLFTMFAYTDREDSRWLEERRRRDQDIMKLNKLKPFKDTFIFGFQLNKDGEMRGFDEKGKKIVFKWDSKAKTFERFNFKQHKGI